MPVHLPCWDPDYVSGLYGVLLCGYYSLALGYVEYLLVGVFVELVPYACQ